MSGTEWAILVGAVTAAMGAAVTAIRAASAAYREAIDRAATAIEHKRLADQATATVTAKNAEIAELKAENARLWDMVRQDSSS
jgi:hypothetical protein